MPELMRSLAARLRSLIRNRRSARRYRARLSLSVTLPDKRANPTRAPRHLSTLEGYTRDLSATGLAVIVPGIRIGERYLTSDSRLLTITLKLPTASVEMRVRPVRYEKLDEEEKGYLIGVSIEEMSDEDRAGFNAYLQQMESASVRR